MDGRGGIPENVACPAHATGYDSTCNDCNANVARIAAEEFPGVRPATLRHVVFGMLVIASPTIARKCYWSLAKAYQGKELTAQDKHNIRQIMDMMQDCVEKVR